MTEPAPPPPDELRRQHLAAAFQDATNDAQLGAQNANELRRQRREKLAAKKRAKEQEKERKRKKGMNAVADAAVFETREQATLRVLEMPPADRAPEECRLIDIFTTASIPLRRWFRSTGISAAGRVALGRSMRLQRYFFGQMMVFRDGDPSDCLYIVLAGSVNILVTAGQTTSHVATIKEGEAFGELGMVNGEPRRADALSGQPGTDLLRVDKAAYEEHLRPLEENRLQSRLEFCRTAPAMEGWAEPEMKQFAEVAQEKYYSVATVMFAQGDPVSTSEYFSIIRTGELRIVRTLPPSQPGMAPRHVDLCVLGPRSLVGELSHFRLSLEESREQVRKDRTQTSTKHRHSVSAITVTCCRLWVVHRNTIFNLLTEAHLAQVRRHVLSFPPLEELSDLYDSTCRWARYKQQFIGDILEKKSKHLESQGLQMPHSPVKRQQDRQLRRVRERQRFEEQQRQQVRLQKMDDEAAEARAAHEQSRSGMRGSASQPTMPTFTLNSDNSPLSLLKQGKSLSSVTSGLKPISNASIAAAKAAARAAARAKLYEEQHQRRLQQAADGVVDWGDGDGAEDKAKKTRVRPNPFVGKFVEPGRRESLVDTLHTRVALPGVSAAGDSLAAGSARAAAAAEAAAAAPPGTRRHSLFAHSEIHVRSELRRRGLVLGTESDSVVDSTPMENYLAGSITNVNSPIRGVIRTGMGQKDLPRVGFEYVREAVDPPPTGARSRSPSPPPQARASSTRAGRRSFSRSVPARASSTRSGRRPSPSRGQTSRPRSQLR